MPIVRVCLECKCIYGCWKKGEKRTCATCPEVAGVCWMDYHVGDKKKASGYCSRCLVLKVKERSMSNRVARIYKMLS